MSLSKGKIPATAEEPQRQPKCCRCRSHGLIVPQKGHMKRCPFLKCSCAKCLLVTERTRIAALQRNLRRAEKNKRKNTAAAAERPLDLRCAAAAGGEFAARSDSTDAKASSTTGEPCNFKPTSVPYFGQLRPSAPLPFIHFPFRVCGEYPNSYIPCPAFMTNVPFLPRVPAEQYTHGLYRPLIFPHYQEAPMDYPLPQQPRPPAPLLSRDDSQEEPMSTQAPEPPLTKHPDADIVELD